MNVAKRYGDTFVYAPIPCWTGAMHAQPNGNAVRLEACCAFTDDYKVLLDGRGALDAPDTIPRGGVRGQDFETSNGCILIAHERREGWFA